MGKVNIIYFSKTIAAYCLKDGRCIALDDLMKLHEYQMSRSFFGLGQRSFGFPTFFSQKLLGYLKPTIL